MTEKDHTAEIQHAFDLSGQIRTAHQAGETQEQIMVLFDNLIEFLLDTFGDIPTTREDVKQAIEARYPLVPDVVKSLHPGVLPVVFVRSLIQGGSPCTSIVLSKNWQRYVNKMAPLLLSLTY